MSVINQMLKDLDKRQQGHGVQQLPNAVAVMPANKTSGSVIWLGVALLVLILLAVYAVMAWQQTSSATQMPQLVSNQAPAEAVVATASEAATASEVARGSETPAQAAQRQTAALESPVAANTDNANGDTLMPQAQQQAKVAQQSEPEAAQPSLQTSSPSHLLVAPADQSAKLPAASSSEPLPADGSSSGAVSPAPIDAASTAQKPAQQTGNMHAGTMEVTEVRLSAAEQADRAMQKARAAQNAGKLNEAAALYGEALALEPARHQARRQLAALRYGQGRVAEAIQVLEAGRSRFPDEYSFALLLARLWREQSDFQQALTALAAIADSSPLASDKWQLTADIAREQENYPLAEQAYRQLLTAGSGPATWWLGLAYAQDAQGNFAEAGDNYRRALRGRELSADARSFVQNRLMQLGERQ
ncbi:tetratricopeptide repeat protein [Shewanella khirikhana]|uniref:Tetratricopeptide repeat protein n=1 Tax=Shewanella khirikhana TaxID=1965282 RepID=A0ABN5U1E9_9GAMM|nr:tetratricopeptide repeat protein [Shewanella khirikhana]AZQ13207.1 Tetratricopeptide repeat protein [Shewanella khirikhana]